MDVLRDADGSTGLGINDRKPTGRLRHHGSGLIEDAIAEHIGGPHHRIHPDLDLDRFSGISQWGEVMDLLVDDDLGEARSQHPVDPADDADAGFLQIVVEDHIVDVTKRVEVREPSIHGHGDHDSNVVEGRRVMWVKPPPAVIP